jgi:Zn finger protein HypA/HybF involved in hydrogenase expression
MHEHGLVDRLMERALAEAAARGKRLRAVHVRLGAMATLDETALRAAFEHVLEHLGRDDVALVVERWPDRPTGIELVGIDLGG